MPQWVEKTVHSLYQLLSPCQRHAAADPQRGRGIERGQRKNKCYTGIF